MKNAFALRSLRRSLSGRLVTLSLLALLAACSPAAQPAATPVAAQPTNAPAATEAPTQAPIATEMPAAATEAAPTATAAPTQAPEAPEAPAAAVSFAADVQPLLDQRCLNCHGGKDGIKGGLSVKSYDDIMKGGDDGAAIIPGDADNSLLVQLIVEGEMPKRAPKLPQAEIDVIAAWVAAGAQND